MIFVIMLIVYLILDIVRRILKPRLIPRRYDYDFDSKLAFIIILVLYIVYKMNVCNMSLADIRHVFYATSTRFYIWNYNCYIYTT